MFVFVVNWKNVILVGLRIEDVIAGDFGGSVREGVLAGTERMVPIGGLPPPFPVSLLLLRRPVPTHFRALSFLVFKSLSLSTIERIMIFQPLPTRIYVLSSTALWSQPLSVNFGHILIYKPTFALVLEIF